MDKVVPQPLTYEETLDAILKVHLDNSLMQGPHVADKNFDAIAQAIKPGITRAETMQLFGKLELDGFLKVAYGLRMAITPKGVAFIKSGGYTQAKADEAHKRENVLLQNSQIRRSKYLSIIALVISILAMLISALHVFLPLL